MGIFGPSRKERERIEEQHWAVLEYENAIKQGIQFVRDKPKIMEIIEPGLKSSDAKKIINACTQAYAMVYSLRYSLFLIRSFNEKMQTLAAIEKTPEERTILRFHDEVNSMLETLMEKVKKITDETEYLKFIDILDGTYATGKFGLKL
jgi:hypothetical protein